ncbi:MAG: hypothetical protein DWQ01_14350 [Planctomycetota bacterium]|nr:MAG: hypothetical protein DWQ01_14350 [Planctomycetota bacterium]
MRSSVFQMLQSWAFLHYGHGEGVRFMGALHTLYGRRFLALGCGFARFAKAVAKVVSDARGPAQDQAGRRIAALVPVAESFLPTRPLAQSARHRL